jgi:hypothetical protein
MPKISDFGVLKRNEKEGCSIYIPYKFDISELIFAEGEI